MCINLVFMNEWRTILGKKTLQIETMESVSLKDLIQRLQSHEPMIDFSQEIKSVTILHQNKLLRIPQDDQVKINPGEKVMFIPPIVGG